jgi:hypothetical protein
MYAIKFFVEFKKNVNVNLVYSIWLVGTKIKFSW